MLGFDLICEESCKSTSFQCHITLAHSNVTLNLSSLQARALLAGNVRLNLQFPISPPW